MVKKFLREEKRIMELLGEEWLIDFFLRVKEKAVMLWLLNNFNL